jgi:hypothetical protein
MQFNGEANGLDLYSDALYLCGLDETSDTTSYPIKAFTRNANLVLDRVIALILKSDAQWEFDDTNNTDLPIATTNLVANQQDYSIAVTQLKIRRVRIKDPNGNWTILNPVSRKSLNDGQLDASAGTPDSYDPLGSSIFLYPTPSYSSTSGLELQFQRGASYFDNGDTTKTPGFATQFHRLVSLGAALNYCEVNSLNTRVAMIQAKITAMEDELTTFYSNRNADQQPSITFKREDYGERGLTDGISSNPHGF